MMKKRPFLLMLVSLIAAGCAEPSATPSAAPPAAAQIATITTAIIPIATDVSPTSPATATSVPATNGVYVHGAVPSSAYSRLGAGAQWSFTVSPDEKFEAFGSTAGLYMFDNTNGQQLWSVATRSAVKELVWTPDSKQIIGRLFEWGNVLIWDAQSGDLVHRLENGSEVAGMSVSPGGTKLAVGLGTSSLDDRYDSINGIALWDLATGSRLVTWTRLPNGHNYDHPVVGLDWSPNGTLVAATVGYLTTAIIDIESGQTLHVLTQPKSPHGEVQYAHFSPDGSKLVTYTGISGPPDAPGGDTNAYVWDVYSGETLFAAENDHVVDRAIWSSDGSVLATTSATIWVEPEGAYQQEIRFWDVERRSLLQAFDGADRFAWSDDPNIVTVYYDTTSESVRVNLKTGVRQPVSVTLVTPTNPARPPIWLVSPKGRLIWSPDNTLIASAPTKDEGQIIIWSRETGLPVETMPAANPTVPWISNSEVSSPLDYCEEQDSVVEIMGESTRRVAARAETVQSNPSQTRSPRNTTIFFHSESTGIKTVDSVYEEDSIVCVMAFSPDARYLAVGHGPLGRGVWAIQNTNIDDNYITIWDVQTGQLAHKFLGHTGSVLQLVWSPDGNWLASLSSDDTALIWKVR